MYDVTYMSTFIEHYKWCVQNNILLPSHGDQFKTIEEMIIQRFQRKTHLTFMFYYHNKFYKKTWDLMMTERQKINYLITIINQIIRKKKLCYDMRYIIIKYIC